MDRVQFITTNNSHRWTEIRVQVGHDGRDTIEFVEEDSTPSDHITYVSSTYYVRKIE